jgi:protein phosphatase
VDIEGPLAIEPNDAYLLCSDGLSGPIPDPELGAFAGHFHPKDACRYLLNLANLRGGLDNITVVVLHLGPWVEPDTAEDLAATPSKDSANGKKAERKRFHLSSLFGPRNKTPALATVEDHPYRTAECPITKELIDKYLELTRRAQAQAVENAWSLDWTQFAKHRRAETEARAADNLRLALRELGEMMVLLGQAARFHRKASNAG